MTARPIREGLKNTSPQEKPFSLNVHVKTLTKLKQYSDGEQGLNECVRWLKENHPQYPFFELISLALKSGMKVVALDKGSVISHLQKKAAVTDPNFENQAKIEHNYVAVNLRERSWARKLREAKKGDLIVMHPVHAFRVAGLIGIPKLKVKWFHPPKFGMLLEMELRFTPKRTRWLKELRHRQREMRKKVK